MMNLPEMRTAEEGSVAVSSARPRRKRATLVLSPWPVGRLAVGLLIFLALGLTAPSQLPPYFNPPPATTVGPTAGATLRNAANATLTQADIVIRAADAWGRRANSGNYQVTQFQLDYGNFQAQFGILRAQFESLAGLAAQLGRPRADNAIAELNSGLNIIAELFPFLENQFNAGTLDRNTIVRTCRSFEDALKVWERELKKSSGRLGLVW